MGVWTFYGPNRQSELVYDYTQKLIISINRTPTVASVAQIREGDSLRNVVVDTLPVFLASANQIYGTLARTARFPVHLAKSGAGELSFQVLVTVSPAGASYRILPSNPDAEFSRNAKQAAILAFEGVEWVPATRRASANPRYGQYLLEKVVLTTYSVTR